MSEFFCQMCGIAGFLGYQSDTPGAKRIAAEMADALVHRGPDDSGVWTDPRAGLAFSHRRLAIIDLSSAGHQPMVSACERYVLTYNGEIYNHHEIRSELEEQGVRGWRGQSDTETLLAGIACWGLERTLRRCVGMFAFAVWDRTIRQLSLARDRMGEKPLYYGWQNGVFLFGSELKALRRHPAFDAKPSRGAAALLLRYNYIPSPYSIYESIRKLPAGCSLQVSLQDRDSAVTAYWSLDEVAVTGQRELWSGDERSAIDSLDRILASAVQGQSVADVPLGALLSGGIDSSLITSVMQAHSSKRVRTYTIGFSDPRYNEAAHAAKVAKHLGTDHTEVTLSSEDALALVPGIPAVYDEPFADASQLPTQLVMRLARQHVTVAVSGDGGDEMFGGYNRYRLVPALRRRTGWIPKVLRKQIGAALQCLDTAQWDWLLGALAHRRGIAQIGDKVHKSAERLHAADTDDNLFLAVVSEWEAGTVVKGGVEPRSRLSDTSSWPPLAGTAERMMAVDATTYLPDDILVKVDRAAMAVSLETRAPFLDPNVVAFAWRLPLDFKIRAGEGKWLLRQLLYRYVPQRLVDRPKMGFGAPLDSWLRGPLRDWAETLLAPDTLRRHGVLNEGPVRQVWDAHLKGRGSYGHRMWSVLMLQAWLDAQ